MTDFIDELLEQNLKAIKPYLLKNKIEAYRILHNMYQELPVAVDIYKNNAVVHLFGPINKETQKNLEESLKKKVGAQFFFYKNRTKSQMQLPTTPKKEITINEYGNTFSINLSDYVDTGIFLDHRETRRWIGSQSKNKKVLNTFAYTSSFTVYAAQGGAQLTHSVDLSRVYGEWTKKNFALNNMTIEQHWFLKMDAREYFKYAKKKKLSFDIIIIDPPTFSRNKGDSFSVQKDHPELINEALEILTPKGFILFSNNFQNFSLSEAKLKNCIVEQKYDTIPPDFEGTVPHQCFVITKP